jgi:ABC-2 type transport system permease protein
VVALGVRISAMGLNVAQFNAANNIVTMVLAGLGGALVPVSLLPGWLQPVAPLTPSYWVMRGCRQVIVQGHGLTGVLPSLAVLAGLTLVAATAGAMLLRPDRAKEAYT